MERKRLSFLVKVVIFGVANPAKSRGRCEKTLVGNSGATSIYI